MWFTPIMTISHLTFSLILTIYILGAIQLEEKDLVAVHGDDYLEYKNRVPMIIPALFPPQK
jgi:protein-S-isoprenylcysteine O-methyltransferase Ste14